MAQVSTELLDKFKKSHNISDNHVSIRNTLQEYNNIIAEHSPLSSEDADMMLNNLDAINTALFQNRYETKADSENATDLMMEVRNTINNFFNKNSLGDAGLPITDIDVQQGSSF